MSAQACGAFDNMVGRICKYIDEKDCAFVTTRCCLDANNANLKHANLVDCFKHAASAVL